MNDILLFLGATILMGVVLVGFLHLKSKHIHRLTLLLIIILGGLNFFSLKGFYGELLNLFFPFVLISAILYFLAFLLTGNTGSEERPIDKILEAITTARK